jgi:Beta-Casp domain
VFVFLGPVWFILLCCVVCSLVSSVVRDTIHIHTHTTHILHTHTHTHTLYVGFSCVALCHHPLCVLMVCHPHALSCRAYPACALLWNVECCFLICAYTQHPHIQHCNSYTHTPTPTPTPAPCDLVLTVALLTTHQTGLVQRIVTSKDPKGGRCLIPVFALGRAQELLLILDEFWKSNSRLHGIPIYYASSLAKKCMSVYRVGSHCDDLPTHPHTHAHSHAHSLTCSLYPTLSPFTDVVCWMISLSLSLMLYVV